MKIKMMRTAVGEIDGHAVHYEEGREYDAPESVALKLADANACALLEEPAPKAEPAPEPETATEPAAAEVAEAPKPKRRGRRKRAG